MPQCLRLVCGCCTQLVAFDLRLLVQDAALNSDSVSAADCNLEHIASQAAGMLPIDLMAISADAASSAALESACLDLSALLDGQDHSLRDQHSSSSETPAKSLRLAAEHYESGLQNLRQRTAVAIGAPQVSLRMPLHSSGTSGLQSALAGLLINHKRCRLSSHTIAMPSSTICAASK